MDFVGYYVLLLPLVHHVGSKPTSLLQDQDSCMEGRLNQHWKDLMQLASVCKKESTTYGHIPITITQNDNFPMKSLTWFQKVFLKIGKVEAIRKFLIANDIIPDRSTPLSHMVTFISDGKKLAELMQPCYPDMNMDFPHIVKPDPSSEHTLATLSVNIYAEIYAEVAVSLSE